MFRWFESLVNPYPTHNLNTPLSTRFSTFVWQATQGIRPYLLILLLCTTGAATFEVLLFSYIGKLVDWLSKSNPAHFLQDYQQSLMLLVGILLLNVFFASMQTIIKYQVIFGNFPMRLRWRFHNLLLGQSLDFFYSDFAGRLSAKVMQTALAVREFWMILADMLAYVLIYFITINVVLGQISLLLVVPLLLWLGLFIGVALFFIPKLAHISRKQADARAVMTGRITDAYTNIQTVKLFAHAGRELQYAKASMQDFMQPVYVQMRLAAQYAIALKLLNAFLYLSVIGTAVWLWMDGQTELGVIAATTAMVLKLDSMSEFVMWNVSMLFENVGTIQDGISSMGKPIAVQDKADAVPLQVHQGEIQFKAVYFGYRPEQPIMQNFNLQIKAGEKIGIVGRSGAGKSTLIQLLLHFYPLQRGEILIDGQNIENVTQDSLRKHIALVTQDTSLLHRTVMENVQYGKPNATAEEIQHALKQAQALHFIDDLIDQKGNTGLNAYVGERGVKLSGGQRQRIAIARVFLKDAPILILDEATSALDSEVEAAIQESLEQLMQHKTVIAIAHRLSTIAKMDRLIVLDQGSIIEQGSHDELLAKNGLYAQLWARQSGGFLKD